MFSPLPRDDGHSEHFLTQSLTLMALLLSPQEPTTPSEDPAMTKLKSQLADGSYDVDSGLVADAILRKLQMIRSARRQLSSAPDRTPGSKLRGP